MEPAEKGEIKGEKVNDERLMAAERDKRSGRGRGGKKMKAQERAGADTIFQGTTELCKLCEGLTD